MRSKRLRIAIHVQHLMGIGHLRRAATIARACAEAGHVVLCVSGGMPVDGLDTGAAGFAQLPPVRAQDLSYKTLVDAAGNVVDERWKAHRRDSLLSRVAAFKPDIIITEMFPFGRRLLRFELEPLIEWAADHSVRLVASIRDILEGFPGPAGRMDDVVNRVNGHYDLVLVHSDPEWVVLADTFPDAARIADKVRYTGYVAAQAATDTTLLPGSEHSGGRNNEVLVSTGGGVVGYDLAASAVATASLSPASRTWRVLIGPNLPDSDFQALKDAASDNTVVERNRPDFGSLLARAAVSVSQCGYNTVADLLATSTPAVLVPFFEAGQVEQTRRARLLAERGRAVVVDPAAFGPAELADAVEAAVGWQNTTPPARLDGATRVAGLLEELMAC